MINWLEKNFIVPGIISTIIAVFIFYMSSLSFPYNPTGSVNPSYLSYVYHFGIFFLLSFFFLLSIIRGKNYELFFISIVILIFYGVLDEVHQLYVVGRFFSFLDIITNSLGILSFFLFYEYLIFIRKDESFG